MGVWTNVEAVLIKTVAARQSAPLLYCTEYNDHEEGREMKW